MLTKKEKSLEDLIPKEFTLEHDSLIRDLMKRDRNAYNEIFELANGDLEDRELCAKYGFDYDSQKQGDLFKLIYAYALQKGYIKIK